MGTAPLSYQWLQNLAPLANGGNISGAITATLTLTSVTQTNAGNCTVVITNAGGQRDQLDRLFDGGNAAKPCPAHSVAGRKRSLVAQCHA